MSLFSIFFKKEGSLETELLAVTLYSPPPKDTEVQIHGDDRPTMKKPAQWLLLYTLKVLEFFRILPKHVGGATTWLPGKHTVAVTTGHRRGARGSRTSLSLLHLMLRTRLVTEASVKLVDGICLMLADRRVEYSHSNSVSEYSRHFCVCNTHCGSCFLFVGKT